MPGDNDPFRTAQQRAQPKRQRFAPQNRERADQLSLRLLGQPALFKDETPVDLSPGAIMLCAYLALAPGDGRPRSAAAAQFFADCPESVARRRFNTALWRLKAEM